MPDYTIECLRKGAEIIKLISKHPRPMVPAEIEHFTSLNKNQVFRILRTLSDAGIVEEIEGRWCLSVQFVKLINMDAEHKLARVRRAHAIFVRASEKAGRPEEAIISGNGH